MEDSSCISIRYTINIRKLGFLETKILLAKKLFETQNDISKYYLSNIQMYFEAIYRYICLGEALRKIYKE